MQRVKRSLVWGVSGVLAWLLVAQAPAAHAAGKIAFVDIANVFDNYQKTKESDKELEAKSKGKESELEGKVAELKKLRDGLDLLSDKAKEERQKQIEDKTAELQQFRLAAQNELRRQRDTIAREILKEIDETVQGYAQAQGYDLILNQRTLVYGAPAMDVTSDVLKQLNSKAKKP